jgi:ribosome modulation factor
LLNGETTTNLSPKFESKHSYYKALITQRSNNMCDYQLWRVDKKTNQIFNIREQLNGTIVEHRFG